MFTFKKYDNQKTAQVSAKLASGSADWTVGDLFSLVPDTGVAAKVSTLAEAKAAIVAGSQLYVVAQGDAVTDKTGTPYKSYKIDRTVKMSNTPKIVVAYIVEDIHNLDGYTA